jgi:hypothetical protein
VLAGESGQAIGFARCGRRGRRLPELYCHPRSCRERLDKQARTALLPQAVDGDVKERHRTVRCPDHGGGGADEMHTRRVDGIRDDARDPVADLGRAPNRIGGREDEQQGRVTFWQRQALSGRDDRVPDLLAGISPVAPYGALSEDIQ